MQTLAEFNIPSQPGNERKASKKVARIVQQKLNLPREKIERLQTAVGEAVMNAMEHGNHYQHDLPVRITVQVSPGCLTVSIQDEGGEQAIEPPEAPDLEAKLAGLQSPRGWGLFLINKMVDDVKISTEGREHTVKLIMQLERDEHGR